MQANKIIEEEEEESGPTLIAKLEEFGIAAADVKKLMEAGFQTIEAVTFTAKKNLITTATNQILKEGFLANFQQPK